MMGASPALRVLLLLSAVFAVHHLTLLALRHSWLTPADIAENRIDQMRHAFDRAGETLGRDDVVDITSDGEKRGFHLAQFFLAPRRVVATPLGEATVGLYERPNARTLAALAAEGLLPIASAPPYVLFVRK